MEEITDTDYMFKVKHYYLLMYLRILEINVLKYMVIIMIYVLKVKHYYLLVYLRISIFLSASGLASQACLKKKEVKLELLTDIHMLLVVK